MELEAQPRLHVDKEAAVVGDLQASFVRQSRKIVDRVAWRAGSLDYVLEQSPCDLRAGQPDRRHHHPPTNDTDP
jgi:hypothetical protein